MDLSGLPAAPIRHPVEHVGHQQERLPLLVREPLALDSDLAQEDSVACGQGQLDDALVLWPLSGPPQPVGVAGLTCASRCCRRL